MDIVIQPYEMKEFLKQNSHCHNSLLQGYKEAISDMTDSILSDPRSSKNTHMMNENFVHTPKYFIGFVIQPDRMFVLSCLYVFPEFRGKGLGEEVLNAIQAMVGVQGAIQVAVEEEKLPLLDRFYKKHSFQSTGALRTNVYGKGYVDYFWSGQPIKLIDYPEGTRVLLLDSKS